jgi:hypothetical protein
LLVFSNLLFLDVFFSSCEVDGVYEDIKVVNF